MRGGFLIAVALATACGRVAFDRVGDASTDGEGEMLYVDVAEGWSVSVFRDFSSDFTFELNDFVDGPSTYSNAPLAMFALNAPFRPALAVVAGRLLIEIDATTYVAHDFGMHAPDTNQPDHFIDGTWVPSLDAGGPALLMASSSANTGDGIFAIAPDWSIQRDYNTNNALNVMRDQSGAFDARGVTEDYFLGFDGLVRRSDTMTVLTDELRGARLIGSDLLACRRLATQQDTPTQLIQIASGTHAVSVELELPLAEPGIAVIPSIELGEGVPPAPFLAWVLITAKELVAYEAPGARTVIASVTSGDYMWRAAVTPPPGHPLAGSRPRVYVLESNRTLDLDRILVLEAN